MEKKNQPDVVRGHINTIILSALCEGDKYGYEIGKEIEAKTRGQYKLKEPTLYSSLKRLEKQLGKMHGQNSHEFMRCIEVEDMFLMGELAFYSALERKETRGRHIRADYPFTNSLLNGKFVTIEKKDGRPVTGWRDKHK